MLESEPKARDGEVCNMRKISLSLFIIIGLFGFSGCKLLKNVVSNVSDWDVSACDSDLDVCLELFADNPGKL